MSSITKEQYLKLEELATIVSPKNVVNLTNTFVKEVEDESYLSQDQFKDSIVPCLDRGIAILKEAGDEVTPEKASKMQYVIAVHRKNTHNEDTASEIKMSTDMMTTEQIDTLSVNSWWHG